MFQGNRSHRDTNSVDAQPLQTLDVGLGEPGFPMLIEYLVGSVRVRLGERTIGLV